MHTLQAVERIKLHVKVTYIKNQQAISKQVSGAGEQALRAKMTDTKVQKPLKMGENVQPHPSRVMVEAIIIRQKK